MILKINFNKNIPFKLMDHFIILNHLIQKIILFDTVEIFGLND